MSKFILPGIVQQNHELKRLAPRHSSRLWILLPEAAKSSLGLLLLFQKHIPDCGSRITTAAQLGALEDVLRFPFARRLHGLLLLLPARCHILHELPAELLRQALVCVAVADTSLARRGGLRLGNIVYID